MIMQALNTMGMRVPTKMATVAFQLLVSTFVTSASIITMPITPIRAVVKAEFILPIYFLPTVELTEQQKKRHSLNYVSPKAYYLIVSGN